jgi:hypothetical protein
MYIILVCVCPPAITKHALYKQQVGVISCIHSRTQMYLATACLLQFMAADTSGRAAARWLGLQVRFPPGAWMCDSRECCVFPVRGLCFGLITRPEEPYQVWCVSDRVASTMSRPWLTWGCCAMKTINIEGGGKSEQSTA